MNPAVVFTRIANEARSVILASGTLSPISSFESELGTKFLYKLNTNHIIPKEQVYIRCIPQGPNGVVLEANYKNSNSWEFIVTQIIYFALLVNPSVILYQFVM